MKNVEFPMAIWSIDWDGILGGAESCDQGRVSYLEKDGIVLDIPFGQILDVEDGTIEKDGDSLSRLDWLYGFSQNGKWIALRDVSSSGVQLSIPGGTHQRLRASGLLCGSTRFNPNSNVESIELDINGLTEWLQQSSISQQREYEDDRLKRISINVDLTKGDIVILSDESWRISIFHRTKQMGGIGIEIEDRCILRVEFKREASLEDAESLAFSLGSFFSFCFGFYAEIDIFTVGFEEGSTAELLTPLVKGKAPRSIEGYKMPFPYSRLEPNIDVALSHWIVDDDLRGPSRLLVSTLFNDWLIPVDLRFIAAAQLLEALSRVRADLESMGKEDFEEYKSQVKKALSFIEDEKVRTKAREQINLNNRKGQSRLLREMLGRHEQITQYLFEDFNAFTVEHARLRNAITHRDKNVSMENRELFWHTEGVLLLAYGVLAELLGLTSELVISGIEQSAFKWKVPEWTREAYRAKGPTTKTDSSTDITTIAQMNASLT